MSHNLWLMLLQHKFKFSKILTCYVTSFKALLTINFFYNYNISRVIIKGLMYKIVMLERQNEIKLKLNKSV